MIIPKEIDEKELVEKQKQESEEVFEIDETPKIEMSEKDKEAFEFSEKKKTLITVIVGVCLNVISLAIILIPMFVATKSTCKGLESCSAIGGMPFIFIPAAVVTSIYSGWISTFIYWHETEMDPNGKQTRRVPKKLMRVIIIENGVLALIFLGLAMLVLSIQT